MLTFFHPEQLLHIPRTYLSRGKMREPQEVPARAERLVQAARGLGFEIRTPADAGVDPLAAVHDPAYLQFLRTAHAAWRQLPQDWGDEVMSNIFVRERNPMRGILAQAARYLADGSCPVGEHTWRAAYWSAQSALAAADAVAQGEQHSYALSRPPGHHARRDAAGGFCYINNAAVAAQRLRARYDRVLILDTDMHHGQGIQEIFYDRDDVMYVSIHGDPTDFYPVVAGFAEERGAGAGYGFNLNLPMPHRSPEPTFFAALDQAIHAIHTYRPQALVLALGFDIYLQDPQAQVAVTTPGFGRLGSAIGALALPTVVVQEGGYHIDTLEQNLQAFMQGLQA